MKKVLVGILAVALFFPSSSFAWGWRGPRRVVVVGHHHDGGAIAAGVLGGIVTGVILDRVFTPSAPPPAQTVYAPPPLAPRDPYDNGYWEGYKEGVERGRQERYEQGRRRGYEEGHDAARAGRAWD